MAEERAAMVKWFNPFQLMRTGVQVALATALAGRADARLWQASGPEPEQPGNHSTGDEIWIDYVADLGDGWDSTFAVASLLAEDTLTAPTPSGSSVTLQRGDILVMGGDEVYLTASREEYRKRTVRPYRCARRAPYDKRGDLFALPGNHDWYDGLTAFTRRFRQQRGIGLWQTRQTRSYFATKLPHGWWLLGVDIPSASGAFRESGPRTRRPAARPSCRMGRSSASLLRSRSASVSGYCPPTSSRASWRG